MSSALTSTRRKWTSFLQAHNDYPLKDGIFEHMNLVSATHNFVQSASYYQEVQLAMEVPETGIDRGVGRKHAIYSALALMILFSIKSRNCVWLRNKSLASHVYHMPFTGVDNALHEIRYAVNQAKRNDPFFAKETPRPYDNSNVSERETAIAVGATCAAMYGDIVLNLFAMITGPSLDPLPLNTFYDWNGMASHYRSDTYGLT